MAKKKKVEKAQEMPQEITKKNVEDIIERIEKEIKKCEDKAFNVYFYVIDTKGVPSGSLLYIYKMAYELKGMGYNVTMLHSEKEFVGIDQWAEEKYATLPHAFINDRKTTVSPSDFLVIPEIYTDIMSQTRDLNCKRVVLLQNFDYMTRIIPPGVHPYEYGVVDVITNTEYNEKFIQNNLPKMRTHIVRPGISSAMFRENEEPKKMIVNFAVKDANDASRIVKPFFWKYPQLKWITFAQLQNLPQETFANALRDAAITIVVDESTSFSYAALEALKTGSIVICKIPQNIPEWMYDGEELTNAIVWVDNLDEVADVVANLAAMWVRDDIPDELYEEMKKKAALHTMDDMREDIKKVFVDTLFVERKTELENALKSFVENKEKTVEE